MTTMYDGARAPVPLGQALKSGGEGAVYHVRGKAHLLAKVYHAGKLPNEAKLIWMRDHPPADPTAGLGHVSIAWPRDLLYDGNRRCVGFLMPYVQGAVPILHVYNPRLRQRFGLTFNWKYLHRTARNLASAMSAVHARDYVVGDVNEGNILVTQTALVTLIDTDSFQVREQRGQHLTVHRCTVYKEEFTPPELQGADLKRVVREPYHDAFGLAVVVFRLLMEGSHPFRSEWLGHGDPPSMVAKIQQGLFPHQKPTPALVAPPSNMLSLDSLHPDIAFLFRRCFGDGHRDPARRPSAADWDRALERAETALIECRNGHFYSNHLPACSWCGARPAGAQVPLPIPRPPRPVRQATPTVQVRSQHSSPSSPLPRFAASAQPAIGGATAAGVPNRWSRRWTAIGAGFVALGLLGFAVRGGFDVFDGDATGRAGSLTSGAVGVVDTNIANGCWTTAQLVAGSLGETGEGARPLQWTSRPAMTIDPTKRYTAALHTSQGIVEIELLPQEAPVAVNNFVCLARAGFYDGTPFHRVVKGSVIQGGDPTGTGTGGPGYRFADEPVFRDYETGTVAMANAGPDTNGSQFFIVLAGMSGRLPPRYTIFGRVTRGQDVVDAIGTVPIEPGSGSEASSPAEPVTLVRVLITEG